MNLSYQQYHKYNVITIPVLILITIQIVIRYQALVSEFLGGAA